MIGAALLVMVAIVMLPAAVRGIKFTEHDLASEESLWALYERWYTHYSVARDAGEKARRFDVFAANARFINEFNSRGDASYELGLNRFGDMTDDEVRDTYGSACYKKPDSSSSSSTLLEGHDGTLKQQGGALAESSALPTDVDWRMQRNGGRPGCVTDVKDQGRARCGSCWAFPATAVLEGLNSILTDKLVPLSEQQLIDCSTENGGCVGGSAQNAFVRAQGRWHGAGAGLPVHGDAGRLRVPEQRRRHAIDGYARVPPMDEAALRKAVAEKPVVVAIDGSGPAFTQYSRGMFDGPCGTNSTHQVALIGYGKDYDSGGRRREFWLIKNSWGPQWAEYGYMRLARDDLSKQGLCGILMDPVYPVQHVN